MISLKTGILVAAVAVVGMGFGSGASAATTSCSSTIQFNVDDVVGVGGTNDGCAVGSTNQVKNNPAPGTINPDTPFGFGDWIYAGKQNIAGAAESGTVDIGFSYTGGANGGTWAINGALAAFSNLMIVQKGGGGNIDPDNWVAYLFNGPFNTSGDVVSAFVNANNGGVAGISNVSAWVRGPCQPGSFGCGPNTSPPPVPVPAGLPLMLTVIGVGAYMRKRARKSA